ncbi:MAG: hypothetical protein ACREX0_14655 [Noviherbaspirillum sp.]
MPDRRLSEEEARLLARCAHVLMQNADGDHAEAQQFLECAAAAGDKHAQLSLGLWLARMDIYGHRNTCIKGTARYKEAIRWLSMAGELGLAEAWYAIFRIYMKAEFSQRNAAEAQHYLNKAAEGGYLVAQRELGLSHWRRREKDPMKELRAVYWLQKRRRRAAPKPGRA